MFHPFLVDAGPSALCKQAAGSLRSLRAIIFLKRSKSLFLASLTDPSTTLCLFMLSARTPDSLAPGVTFADLHVIPTP